MGINAMGINATGINATGINDTLFRTLIQYPKDLTPAVLGIFLAVSADKDGGVVIEGIFEVSQIPELGAASVEPLNAEGVAGLPTDVAHPFGWGDFGIGGCGHASLVYVRIENSHGSSFVVKHDGDIHSLGMPLTC